MDTCIVTAVSPTKPPEPIGMLFAAWTRGTQGTIYKTGAQIPYGKEQFGRDVLGRPVPDVRYTQ